MLPVPLTVIRQPVEPFAEAVYQIASMMTGSGDPVLPAGSRVVIPVEFVGRASTER